MQKRTIVLSISLPLLVAIGIGVWSSGLAGPGMPVPAQANVPNLLVLRTFIHIDFANPFDWKSEQRGDCIAYIPKGGRTAQLTVTLTDRSQQSFTVDATGSAEVCGDVIHIDTIGPPQ
jgi:hypothetical protein